MVGKCKEKSKDMKVPLACEESQIVCKEFRKLGHEAYSCDIQECIDMYSYTRYRRIRYFVTLCINNIHNGFIIRTAVDARQITINPHFQKSEGKSEVKYIKA